MKLNYKIRNMRKYLLIFAIMSAFLMSGSATVINQLNIDNYQIVKENISPTSIDTIYVDDDNTKGPWDGSLNYPYQYIQDAIDNANIGNTIHVFNGIYYENIVIYLSLNLEGEDRDNTWIIGSSQGTVVKITADSVSLVKFTICYSGAHPNDAGISLHSEQSFVSENTIFDNHYGIRVSESNNTIIYNNFIDNLIHAYDSGTNVWNEHSPGGGNYWRYHAGNDDNEDGVIDTPFNISGDGNQDLRPLLHRYGSVVNVNTSMTFLTIKSAIEDAKTCDGHSILVLNDIYYEHLDICKALNIQGEDNEKTIIDARLSGNPVKIFKDQVTLSGFKLKCSGDEIFNAGIIIYSDEVKIISNIIEENFVGIYLWCSSENNIIMGNIVRNNDWNGICIKEFCKKNIITENTIENNNFAGVAITGANYNLIYHNNFIENRHNALDDSNNWWDDGYPSGGNYWSDYKGKDKNGDGIGDSSYEIPDGTNIDRYPLIYPYTTEDIMPPTVEIKSPMNGLYIRNIRLLQRVLGSTIIFGKVTVEVEASDSQSGVEYVAFYLDNNNYPEVIDYSEPYNWQWSRGTILKMNYFHVIRAVAHDYDGNENVDRIMVIKFL